MLGALLLMAAQAAAPFGSCDLTISFGSYAMGADLAASAEVGLVLRDPAVRSLERKVWGPEGEHQLCVRTTTPADAERLFKRIRPMLPFRPRGPITVTLADGRSYAAPAR